MDNNSFEEKVQLSKQQGQVLRHLALGGTHKTIAQEMGITVPTVRSHLQKAKTKLSAHTATHAVLTAHEMGILPKAALPDYLSSKTVDKKKNSKPAKILGDFLKVTQQLGEKAPWLALTNKEREVFAEYGRYNKCPTNAQIASECGIAIASMKQYARRIKRTFQIEPDNPDGRQIVISLSRVYNALVGLEQFEETYLDAGLDLSDLKVYSVSMQER